MIKISCYKTPRESLAKTFCLLAEKCYVSSFKAYVIADNEDSVQELDKILWTYSRKNFIPHATNKDPLPHKQPILISDKVDFNQEAQILILVNPTRENIIDILTKKKFCDRLSKIIIIFDELQTINYITIKDLFTKSRLSSFLINYFERQYSGEWKEIDIFTDS